jgi:hypothetical protein
VTTQTAAPSGLAFPAGPASPPPDPGRSGPLQPAPGRSGPVPTRPLALGELLDGAVSLLRLYPGPTMGLAAIVMVIQLVLTVPVQYLTQDLSFSVFSPVPSAGASDLDPLLALLGVVLSTALVGVIAGACAGVVAGMTASVVGGAALARPVTASTVWADVRPRLWPLVGLSLLIGLATAIGSLFFWFGQFFVAGAFAIAVPAMMLERTGAFRAIKRGWDLTFTSFGAYMRVVGIRVLAVFVATIWQLLVALPFMAVGQYVLTLGAPNTPAPLQLLLSVFLTGLGTMAGGIVATPFLGCVDGLLYTDRRMRAEGFDIDLGRRLRRGVV